MPRIEYEHTFPILHKPVKPEVVFSLTLSLDYSTQVSVEIIHSIGMCCLMLTT